MIARWFARGAFVAFALVAWIQPDLRAEPVGTALTYQGRLDHLGAPASGACDFEFRLYDAATDGTQIGDTYAVSGIVLTDRLLTTQIDFGAGAFDGESRWLEIAVRGEGEPEFTILAPRQPLTPGPDAIYSQTGSVSGSQWTDSAAGIEYQAGNVAIGAAANSGMALYVEAGTRGINPVYIHNNSAAYGALGVRNDAVNGFGIYDGWSDRHYFGGRIGVGTETPGAPLHAVSSTTAAIIGQHTGNWVGVYGESQSYQGVYGKSIAGPGVAGEGGGAFNAGVAGYSNNANGWGGYFKNNAGGVALYADGRAAVKTLDILGGADIVEGFDTGKEPIEPGTVVVIDAFHAGELRASSSAYDSRVAGIVSGAGGIAPGLRLGQEGVIEGPTPVAMTGRVYARACTDNGPIRPGDRLTTASFAGHAMRATDTNRMDGAVLGKAMTSLESGTGLVLVLVNLQ